MTRRSLVNTIAEELALTQRETMQIVEKTLFTSRTKCGD